MSNKNKARAARVANTAAPVATTAPAGQPTIAATLVGTKEQPVTQAMLWAFINKHGGPASVYVVPLPNVAKEGNPVPFGYNGKPGGVRATIQAWLLNGVQGNRSYAAIMGAAKPLGHSSLKPVCLFAMLNGGYSPSASTWGTAYCQLVAYATQQPAAQPEVAAQADAA